MSEISTIGEFALIDILAGKAEIRNTSTVKGIGDDCAVLQPADGCRLVITSDLLLEGVHFDLTYTPLKHLGYKAAVVNISDICAMNAVPRQLLMNIGVSARFTREDIEELYAGIHLACAQYGLDLAGGDTSASMTGLLLSGTCIGDTSPQQITYRSGAKPTDLICVSGNLGAAYMGLQLLKREQAVFADTKEQEEFNPCFDQREYLLERQLKPEARVDIVTALAEKNLVPTAMIDISDGLSSELLHLSKQSKVGIRIYEDRIPVDYQTAMQAEEMNFNVITAALNGGEDYELLFTLPLSEIEAVQELSDVRIIGYTTEPTMGAAMICRDGSEITLQAQGWTAFQSATE